MWAFFLIAILSLTHLHAADNDCGQIKVQRPNTLIFNGNESYHGQWPWLASIFMKENNRNRYICGSSIITKWHLLTAAHCVISADFNNFYALMGRYDLSNSNEPHGQRRGIEFIHIHENYNKTKFQRSKGDIAIFRLSIEIEFTNYIQRVCLPQSSANVVGMNGFLSGYGQTEPIQMSNENKPSYVELKSIDRWDCLEKGLIYGEVLSEFSFCGANEHSIPCAGDSGGGFYVYDRSTRRFSTFGVLSHGIGQCNPKEYVVFVEVAKYIKWIRKAINSTKTSKEILKPNPCSSISCPDNRTCVNGICIDLCLTVNSCSKNSQCLVRNHKIVCENKSEYETNFIDGDVKYDVDTNNEICGNSRKCLTFFVDQEAKLTSMNTEIRATHRNDKVEGIYIRPNNENWFNVLENFLPIKVDEIFVNLRIYKVSYGSLKQINQENFKNLNKLEMLQINFNTNELVIKENSFNDLRNLKILSLNLNGITKLPNKLLDNRNLEKINLSGNKLTSLNDETFKNLVELKELGLYDNELSSLPADVFKNLNKLQELRLNGNKLKSLEENIFDNLLNLEYLYLHNNELTTLHENILINNNKLEQIYLNDNKITTLSFKIFNNKSKLKFVDLKNNSCINKDYGDFSIILSNNLKQSLRKDLQEKC